MEDTKRTQGTWRKNQDKNKNKRYIDLTKQMFLILESEFSVEIS